jgi:2-C-methyl-D-erythritol 4-phosphate cytidylyltransferase
MSDPIGDGAGAAPRARRPADGGEPAEPDVGVILCGAGTSLRFGGDVPKPFVPLAGEPVFLHSLRLFARLPVVRQIVLAVPIDWVDRTEEQCRAALEDLETVLVIAGGEVRHETVRLALAGLDDACRYVAIHDAARPLVGEHLILEVIARARRVGAAVPALPVTDTVKQTGPDRLVLQTLDRRNLCLTQTPQVIRRDLLTRAFDTLSLDLEPVTDDAQLVERLGEPVAVVPGDPRNFKITRMADLALAEAHLADRGNEP